MAKILILENLATDIKTIARRHGAENLRVFGSFAKGAQTASSDLDLLVDFEPGRDLLDLVGLKQDLEERLGLRVDVVTEQGMSPYLRSRILEEARPMRDDRVYLQHIRDAIDDPALPPRASYPPSL